MEHLRQLVVSVLVAFCLVLGIAMADTPYQVYVDGVEMKLAADSQPVEINNSVLLPMRDLFERLGAKVVWDEASQRVFAVKDKLVMILPLDNDYAYFNGRSVRMAARAQLIGERTYVPLRFVSTILGAGVDYNPVTKRIDITVTPKALPAEVNQYLSHLTDAFAATRQISSYTAELSGHYQISLGDTTVPVEMRAQARVNGSTEMALDYSLSSDLTPGGLIEGKVVAIKDKLYIKAPGQEWATQLLTTEGGGNDLVAGVLAGLAGGDLSTLPLADMFGETLLPKSGALAKMNDQGLLADVKLLGSRELNGQTLQAYRLQIDSARFSYYYSNLAGIDPRAQGMVLDNVQQLDLSTEYWLSPSDQIVYQCSIALNLKMKAGPEISVPTGFGISLSQRLTSVNQAVEIIPPILTTN